MAWGWVKHGLILIFGWTNPLLIEFIIYTNTSSSEEFCPLLSSHIQFAPTYLFSLAKQIFIIGWTIPVLNWCDFAWLGVLRYWELL